MKIKIENIFALVIIIGLFIGSHYNAKQLKTINEKLDVFLSKMAKTDEPSSVS